MVNFLQWHSLLMVHVVISFSNIHINRGLLYYLLVQQSYSKGTKSITVAKLYDVHIVLQSKERDMVMLWIIALVFKLCSDHKLN